MSVNLDLGTPNAKQEEFLKDTHKYVGFGGARGGGKSWAVRAKSIILACTYPGIRQLIVRQSYPELKKNHIAEMTSMLSGIAKYNSTDKQIIFPNGSTIDFQYCKNDKDLQNLQGSQYDCIYIDEATMLSEFQIKAITACCRGVNDFPKHIYLTCNPGGQGHAFIKRIMVDRVFDEGEDPEDYHFIQSFVYDNKVLLESNPDYVKQLEALPPKLREAWLHGSWDIFTGQFFEDFVDDPNHYEDRKFTHVIEPFDIPSGWKIYRSYDFGYSKPFSVGWWAVDYEGTIYRILELYGWNGTPNEGIKWDPAKQMQEIKKVEEQHPWLKGRQIRGVADPAIWQADSGKSVADIGLEMGIYFDKGDNARISGWMQMHYRFSFDENGYPRMYIFNNCKAAIRTIPLMMYSETKVEDLQTELEDHAVDEMRYFCMSRPIKPFESNNRIPIGDDPLNQRAKKKKSIYIQHG